MLRSKLSFNCFYYIGMYCKGITVLIPPPEHKAPKKGIDKNRGFLIRKLLRLLKFDVLNAI